MTKKKTSKTRQKNYNTNQRNLLAIKKTIDDNLEKIEDLEEEVIKLKALYKELEIELKKVKSSYQIKK